MSEHRNAKHDLARVNDISCLGEFSAFATEALPYWINRAVELEKALEIACAEISDHQCPDEFDLVDWPACANCSAGRELRYDAARDIACWMRWAMERAAEGTAPDAGS